MIVTMRAVADRRRALLWWIIGLIALVLLTVSLYPSLKDQQSVDDLMRDLPDAVKGMIGYQETVSLTSPAGFLNARLYSTVVPVVMLVFGIGAGARAIAGAEEDGTLEHLLAQPVTRGRVAAERYLATAGTLAILVTAFTLALIALAPLFDAAAGIPLGRILTASAALYALAALHLTLAYAIGAATGRRGPATAITTSVAATGYLLHSLLTPASTAAPLREISPWHWYLDRNPLAQGVTPTALWLPLLLSALLLATGWALFQRRDLR